MLGLQSVFYASTKTFHHDNKEERGERVSLSDSSGGMERRGGNVVDQNREEGGRYETHYPSYPRDGEAKGN